MRLGAGSFLPAPSAFSPLRTPSSPFQAPPSHRVVYLPMCKGVERSGAGPFYPLDHPLHTSGGVSCSSDTCLKEDAGARCPVAQGRASSSGRTGTTAAASGAIAHSRTAAPGARTNRLSGMRCASPGIGGRAKGWCMSGCRPRLARRPLAGCAAAEYVCLCGHPVGEASSCPARLLRPSHDIWNPSACHARGWSAVSRWLLVH
jgi:hypothetical protein